MPATEHIGISSPAQALIFKLHDDCLNTPVEESVHHMTACVSIQSIRIEVTQRVHKPAKPLKTGLHLVSEFEGREPYNTAATALVDMLLKHPDVAASWLAFPPPPLENLYT